MSTVTTNVPLAEAIIRHALVTYGEERFAPIIEGAMELVLQSTPGHRMAMMQAAIEATGKDTIYNYACELRSDLAEAFETYGKSMSLRSEVLLGGAMLFVMNLAEAPDDLPDFDHICGGELPS